MISNRTSKRNGTAYPMHTPIVVGVPPCFQWLKPDFTSVSNLSEAAKHTSTNNQSSIRITIRNPTTKNADPITRPTRSSRRGFES